MAKEKLPMNKEERRKYFDKKMEIYYKNNKTRRVTEIAKIQKVDVKKNEDEEMEISNDQPSTSKTKASKPKALESESVDSESPESMSPIPNYEDYADLDQIDDTEVVNGQNEGEAPKNPKEAPVGKVPDVSAPVGPEPGVSVLVGPAPEDIVPVGPELEEPVPEVPKIEATETRTKTYETLRIVPREEIFDILDELHQTRHGRKKIMFKTLKNKYNGFSVTIIMKYLETCVNCPKTWSNAGKCGVNDKKEDKKDTTDNKDKSKDSESTSNENSDNINHVEADNKNSDDEQPLKWNYDRPMNKEERRKYFDKKMEIYYKNNKTRRVTKIAKIQKVDVKKNEDEEMEISNDQPSTSLESTKPIKSKSEASKANSSESGSTDSEFLASMSPMPNYEDYADLDQIDDTEEVNGPKEGEEAKEVSVGPEPEVSVLVGPAPEEAVPARSVSALLVPVGPAPETPVPGVPKMKVLKTRTKTYVAMRIVPRDKIFDILDDLHQTHHGRKKTMFKTLKEQYNGISETIISKYLETCVHCPKIPLRETLERKKPKIVVVKNGKCYVSSKNEDKKENGNNEKSKDSEAISNKNLVNTDHGEGNNKEKDAELPSNSYNELEYLVMRKQFMDYYKNSSSNSIQNYD